MTRRKVYVAVNADHKADGSCCPKMIRFDNDRKYEIDKVTDIRQATAMRAGGQGDRYTIYVNGKQSYLYFERSCSLTGNNLGRWFVERRVAS